jgi:hypothetical protein
VPGNLSVAGDIHLGDGCEDELVVDADADFNCDLFVFYDSELVFHVNPEYGYISMGDDDEIGFDTDTGDIGMDGTLTVGGSTTLGDAGDDWLTVRGPVALNTHGGTTTVNGILIANGGLRLGLTSQYFTADAALVPTDAYMQLTSDGAWTMTSINTGTAAGQMLVLTMYGANSVALVDATISNAEISGDFTMQSEDSITFIFNGTNWIELCRSDN